MQPLLFRLLAFSAPLLTPALAHAAFNPAVVSSDARWVVHVDLVTLRESALGQALLTALQQAAPHFEKGGLQPDIEKIIAAAGTVTAYGSNFSKDPEQIDGTLVLQGTGELRKIAEGFIAQATVTEPEKVTEIKGLPFEAYSLGGQATIAFPQEPVILFSKSQTQLVKAYDVFRGSATSLAKKSASPIILLLPKGGEHYLIAASEVPATEGLLPSEGPQARILQMATAGAIALGEEKSMTGARLQLVASTDEMAEKLDRILQGMAAILSLTNTDDQQLAEFLRSVKTERKGQQVSISLAYPSEHLAQMMQDLLQRRAAQPHDAGHDDDGGREAEAAPIDNIGQVVATWHSNENLGGDAPSAQNLASRVVENVTVKTGATITISGRRGGGEHARIDYVEFAPPAGGGPAMRYEAEFMRLENYQIEKWGFVSGGELVRMRDGRNEGSASFRFQGADGTYRVTVGYVDEADGKSAFAFGVQAPVALEASSR
jgi:hypothetical protein